MTLVATGPEKGISCCGSGGETFANLQLARRVYVRARCAKIKRSNAIDLRQLPGYGCLNGAKLRPISTQRGRILDARKLNLDEGQL